MPTAHAGRLHSRQVLALSVPGKFCDIQVTALDEMDHVIGTLPPCTVVRIPRATVEELIVRQPRIARALWWCTLVDENTLREWLVNLGQRPADQCMAHLFCGLLVRLRMVSQADETGFELPLTQQEFSEVRSLDVVHVNRTLQRLRQDGLISLRDTRPSRTWSA